LAAVLETLDTMVRSHAVAAAERWRQLRDLDREYEMALANVEASREPQLLTLRGRLEDARRRARKMMRAAHHLGHTNQRQLRATVRDLESMKTSAEQGKIERQEDWIELNALKSQLAAKRKQLAQKEGKLVEVRQTNQELKAQVWRMRHELRFRRSGLFVED
jgi:chromosome segregation ATPase